MIALPEGSWWDWDVVACDPAHLRLAAGYDLSYHHGLELVFSQPYFVACPTAFQDPEFREPTSGEVRRMSRRLGGAPAVVVAFEADAGGTEAATGLIAAERLDVVRGTVLRYWRADLAAGERLAPWVRPPSR